MRAILTYHSIDASGSPISVTPETFRRHVHWLSKASVAVVGLEHLLNVDASLDAVAITFDDGFANFAKEAWPILQEYDLPVTLFVPAGKVGETNDWSGPGPHVPRFQLLDWGSLEKLVHEGVSIGSHASSHVDLRGLSHKRLVSEVLDSAELLHERLGERPRTFAYPFGKWDRAAREAVESEHTLACTTRLATLPQYRLDPYVLPRLDAYYFQNPGRLESWGNLTFDMYVSARRVARATRSLFESA